MSSAGIWGWCECRFLVCSPSVARPPAPEPSAVGAINPTLLMATIAAILILTYISYRLKFLTFDGTLALAPVLLISTLAFGLGALVLMLFVFLSSSLLGRYRQAQNVTVDNLTQEGSRNACRIIGGAGPSTAVALLALCFPQASAILRVSFVATLGATASDTWASEVGVLSKRQPRLLLPPWPQVEPGRSGAVSMLGEIVSLVGAFFSVAVALSLGLLSSHDPAIILLSFLVAVFAEHLDSVLGASVQAAYMCPVCSVRCEVKQHSCGTQTVLVHGHPWMSNEAVNFLSGCAAAGVALLAQVI
jgi:uncharacterized protein (TIGR00297 family)